MRRQIIFATVSLAACLGASAPQAGKSDQDAIQGVWQAVAAEKQGKEVTKDEVKSAPLVQFTFAGTSVTTKTGKIETTGTFTLDSTKNPKHIDFQPVDNKGNKEGRPTKGIYELSGDDLKICWDTLGGNRPSAFQTKEGTTLLLMVLKRDKK